MTPVPRGLPRTFGILASWAIVAGLPAAAGAATVPTCNGVPATLVVNVPPGTRFNGTAGDDVIVGTAGDDVIYGLAGDDLICAGAGNDLVLGGRGEDEIHGNVGGDVILGGLGNDSLYGGDGSDEVGGDAGRDLVDGGSGQDVLYGGGGPDTVYGGSEADKIYGEAGRDRLYGGDGGDELQGGTEDDSLFGDAGDDYLWGDTGDDTLIGGLGDDLLQGGADADNLQGRGGFDELWGGECGGAGGLAGAVDCRRVPTGRPPGNLSDEPGDTYNGGPALDSCNKRPAALPEGCDTQRGERPGSPWAVGASEEWWGIIEQAFSERALMLVDDEKVGIADALMAEIYHAKQIAACESMGDVFQMSPSTPAGATVDGLFQHKSIYWAGRAEDAGYPGASAFDPLANARVAAWMVAVDIEYHWDALNRIEDRLAWTDWACDEALNNHAPDLWEE